MARRLVCQARTLVMGILSQLASGLGSRTRLFYLLKHLKQ